MQCISIPRYVFMYLFFKYFTSNYLQRNVCGMWTFMNSYNDNEWLPLHTTVQQWTGVTTDYHHHTNIRTNEAWDALRLEPHWQVCFFSVIFFTILMILYGSNLLNNRGSRYGLVIPGWVYFNLWTHIFGYRDFNSSPITILTFYI